MSTTYEDWVAAGKPCLRQSCGHRRGDHIPSEDMECDECDCLAFVGFAHPYDEAMWSSLNGMPVTRRDGDKILFMWKALALDYFGVYMVNEPEDGMRRDEQLRA
ncbi:MAG: hypothetical protein JWR32_854 [Mycobacterium sp.]|jgi:hypothetical protein|nr:hypothetical protein [Mycobacterium sp.]